jgi:predicted alpha/beta superfamily hydrolase
MRPILFSLMVLTAVSAVAAQSAPSHPWTEIKIRSAKLGDTRTIDVATPAGYSDPRRSFPVLVILDADDRDQFTSAVANVSFLASRAATPQMIVVGIRNGKDRTHDLTPVATGANAKQFKTAGGVSTFMDFVIGEVLPQIRAKYRTQPATILAGHSFGGLVALHAASTRDAFTAIIAMSPSLWWNDSTAARGYADSLARLTRPLRLFASSGEFEPPISITTRRFAAARLREAEATRLRIPPLPE